MQPSKFVSLSDLIFRSKKREWIDKYSEDIHIIYTYCGKSMKGFDLSLDQFNTLLYKLSLNRPPCTDDSDIEKNQVPPTLSKATGVVVAIKDDCMTQAELEDYKDADEFSEQVYQLVTCIKKVLKEESLHIPLYPWCVNYQTIYDYIVSKV